MLFNSSKNSALTLVIEKEKNSEAIISDEKLFTLIKNNLNEY